MMHLLFSGALAYLLWQRLHSLMTYFQQEEYDSERFIGAIFRVRLYDVIASLGLIALALISWWAGQRWILLLGGAALFAAVAWREARYVYKKPLAKTQRAQRIIWLAAVGMAVLVLLTLWLPLSALIVLQVAPLAIMVANRILVPFQERINQGFIDQARAKLARLDPVRIGITGSFGKTTVKHMLAEVLEASGPVFYSRGSINTELGLTRHIRERLQWSHRYFIAEMGAYGIGSIARLCRFVEPNFGIITAVGDAHTERFGSVDVIAQAKCELGQSICERGGTVVINAALLDHAPFAKLKSDHPDLVITVGETPDADVEIVSAEMVDASWHIQLRAADFELRYELPLLGDHNVMNSALAVALVAVMDPGAREKIARITPTVEQIPHRLQKREQPGQPLVLDDAYNANEAGFENALEVLSQLASERGGRAVLVTPGVAELGDAHDAVHGRLGAKAAAACDTIYAVNPDRIATFVAAAGQGRAALHQVATLGEARAALREADGSDVILYENDLPDLLETTRLL